MQGGGLALGDLVAGLLGRRLGGRHRPTAAIFVVFEERQGALVSAIAHVSRGFVGDVAEVDRAFVKRADLLFKVAHCLSVGFPDPEHQAVLIGGT